MDAATPRIAIVGAGLCGIAMGVTLVRDGITSFDIYDERTGLGGTWRANDYPGAAVDLPSTVYQFSFKNHVWNRTHARQAELLEYFEETAKEYGLVDHMHLGTKVRDVRWEEQHQHWVLTTATGEERVYQIVVSAVGFLDDPRLPDWPGLETFRGPKFHSTQWDHDLDLSGKRVAVVGVGSSSAQIIPAIQPIVKELVVFQREASWVLPKNDRVFTPEEVRKFASERRRKLERFKFGVRYEWTSWTSPFYWAGSRRHRQGEAAARAFLDASFADRPDLREHKTPKYISSGKRRVVSDDFYPAMKQPNVRLVPVPVERVTETTVVDAEGGEHEVDVLVMATGFKASSYLSKLSVFGRRGLSIHDAWKDGAYAFAGMTVPGFPNFYMLYGPNTNGSGTISINHLAEVQSRWVLRDIHRMRRRGYTSIDTSQAWTDRYNRWLQKRLVRTPWAQANNYMKHESGKIVTNWAGTMFTFTGMLRILRPLGTYGRRGPQGPA